MSVNNSKIYLNQANIKKFASKMQRNKESGGVMNFSLETNGRLKHFTDEPGGNDYQISLSLRGKDYEAMWHTHHYKAKYPKKKTSWVVNKIHKMIDKDKTWDALYYFESDIIRVHPPSPPDVISAFRVCHLNGKRVSFVFAEEGIYAVKPTKALCRYYDSLPTYAAKNKLLNNILKSVDQKYFKIIWGAPRSVTKWLENDDSPKIKKLIKRVQKHTDNTTDLRRIREYMEVVRSKGFKISFMKWNTKGKVDKFFQRSVV